MCILGEDVGGVEDYKYLGVLINNGLNRKTNTEAVYNKKLSPVCCGQCTVLYSLLGEQH